jgi:predicted CoA-binding protein
MTTKNTKDVPEVASHALLCFATEVHGVTSYVWATSKGKAIAATVRQANDAGYRTLWVQVKCRRHASLDDYDLMDRKIRPNRCYAPDHIQHNSKLSKPKSVHNQTGR